VGYLIRVVQTPCRALVEASVLALAVACNSGCDRRADASTPDASAPDAGASDAGPPAKPAPTASASSSPRAAPSGSATAEKPSLQILKFVFTSDVKDKEPVDKLERAQPGQRVYVHLTMRNRASETRPITVVFRVNNEQRSKVDLKVESSWSYRTWAYNTLRTGDLTGVLTAEIRDEGGFTIATRDLPIRNAAERNPVPVPSKHDDNDDD
jgi:hypothetical protein